MKIAVQIAACLALLAVVVLCLTVAHETRHTAQHVRTVADSLAGSVASARADFARAEENLVRLAGQRAASLEKSAGEQLTAARREIVGELGRANDSLAQVAAAVAEIPPEIRPALASGRAFLDASTEAVKDGQAIADDLFPDVRAAVQSGTVAARGVAEASEAAGRAAPQFVAHFERLTDQAAGIATDAHTATSEFVRPKTLRAKIWSGVKLGVYAASQAVGAIF